MKKCLFFFFVLASTSFPLFSQSPIDETLLNNFHEYRGEITDYFSHFFREDYSNDMLYYNSKLMTIFGNILDRKMISDSIIDLVIGLYKDAIAAEVPKEDKEMYLKAGLGENGHEVYVNILSIMYFMDLETNMEAFPPDEREVVKNSANKLKNLFRQNDWDITVNFFKVKYGE